MASLIYAYRFFLKRDGRNWGKEGEESKGMREEIADKEFICRDGGMRALRQTTVQLVEYKLGTTKTTAVALLVVLHPCCQIFL
jgi:hypothetical protein